MVFMSVMAPTGSARLGDLAQALQHGVDTRRGEFQAIHQQGRKATAAALPGPAHWPAATGELAPSSASRVASSALLWAVVVDAATSGCGPGRPAQLCHVLIDIHE